MWAARALVPSSGSTHLLIAEAGAKDGLKVDRSGALHHTVDLATDDKGNGKGDGGKSSGDAELGALKEERKVADGNGSGADVEGSGRDGEDVAGEGDGL